MNGVMLAKKILRQGYWSTMEEDCINFVQRCPKYQIHANRMNIPVKALQHDFTMSFLSLEIDVNGTVSPKGSNGHEFILVVINCFTKWVEAQSYSVLKASYVAKFIRNNVICRYGVPNEIISDNGSHFKKVVMDLLQKYNVAFHESSTYRPQTNGAIEATNKNVKNILRKMMETYKDWPDKLPFAL
ncbi:protein NYNRIN-like [Camellia sinensis]|uniref:protein NYNRIN-like n=1 Tax=Camellia sinensis TaxID=4442 RepID=UPI00103585CC|nr:protein NYNRIN-like [Camellia sinensis]